eukprot:6210611-Pleurochrysis_carterae.AAC.6
MTELSRRQGRFCLRGVSKFSNDPADCATGLERLNLANWLREAKLESDPSRRRAASDARFVCKA